MSTTAVTAPVHWKLVYDAARHDHDPARCAYETGDCPVWTGTFFGFAYTLDGLATRWLPDPAPGPELTEEEDELRDASEPVWDGRVFYHSSIDGQRAADIGPGYHVEVLMDMLGMRANTLRVPQGLRRLSLCRDDATLTVVLETVDGPVSTLTLTAVPTGFESVVAAAMFDASMTWKKRGRVRPDSFRNKRGSWPWADNSGWKRLPAGWPSAWVARIPPEEREAWLPYLRWTGQLWGSQVEQRVRMITELLDARDRLHPQPLSPAEQRALLRIGKNPTGAEHRELHRRDVDGATSAEKIIRALAC